MGRRGELRRGLPALGVAIPIVILFVTILSIPLTAAQKLGLSDAQISSWIVTLYGVATALGLVLAIRYRQPLILTGNVFAIIFIASVHGQVSYRELIGASILAGAVVAILGAIGLSGHLAAWIPSPIVMGLLAGAVLPYVAGVFTALDQERLVVGSTIAAYILGRRFLTSRFPAIFPALLVGIAVTIVSGRLGQTSIHWTLPTIVVTAPTFTLRGFATATPVLVLLMTLQANVPSVVYLRSQGYTPPERTVDVVSGLGTVAGSLLGPTAISIPVLLTPLVAGPDAGEHAIRHWSAYLAGGAGVGIALLAGVAAAVTAVVPLQLLAALAGLALVGVLLSAIQEVARGPLVLGPVFTFAIALSKLSLFGLSAFFWAIVFGMAISLILERDAMRAARLPRRA